MSFQPKKRARRKSFIFRAFGSLNKRFYRLIQNGILGRYLSGYDASCERLKRSFLGRLFGLSKKNQNDNLTKPVAEEFPFPMEGVKVYKERSLGRSFRYRVARKVENSKLVCGARVLKGILLNTPLFNYGFVLFGFALFLFISQALTLVFKLSEIPIGVFTYALSQDTVLTVTYMAVSVILMALSPLWMFAPNGSAATFAFDSALIGSFLRSTMGITHISKAYSGEKIVSRRNAFIAGSFLGGITFFTTPKYFLIGALITILLIFVMNVPEFGLIVGIFVLPYLSLLEHPTVIMAIIVTVVMLSTLLKLLRGKRTYRLEPLDIYVGLFLLLVFLGGIFTSSGIQFSFKAGIFFIFGLSYFIVKILVRDAAWLKRCIDSLVASSILVSILAIVEFVLGKASVTWQDTAVFSALSGRASSLWGNPNILAEFLLVAFFLSLGSLIAQKQRLKKLSALIALALNGVALVFTWSRGAWIAVALTLIGVLLVYSHKSLPFVFWGIVASCVLFFFLPEVFVTRVQSIVTFSDSSTLYRIHIWQGCAAMIRDVFLSGIGVVEEGAFRSAYLPYALSGIESAPHAHNLAMQIVIELGVFGILVFAIMIVSVTRVVFTLFAKCRMKHTVSLYALGVYGAFSALLLHGVTDYVWYNYRIYLLFFVMIGLLSAARQIGNQSLTENLSEANQCDLDITVRK